MASMAVAAIVVHGQFRARATVVLVDVVVRDQTGATVDDLDATAFEVFEDGSPRPVVSFERLGGAEESVAPPPVDDRPWRWDAEAPSRAQSVTAIVFHRLDLQSRVSAVRAASRIVDALGAADFIGVYSLEDQLRELAPFTRDVPRLRRALVEAGTTASSASTASGAPGVAESDSTPVPTGPSGISAAAMRARMAAAMAQLERHYAAGLQGSSFHHLITTLAQFPGRRSVILFSRGLATPDVVPKLEGVVAEARRQNVSFYCIDAGGLGTTGRRTRATRRLSRRELTSRSGDEARITVRIAESDPTDALGPLAEMTGGLLVADTNDINAAASLVNADRRRYYLLGYSSREGIDPEAARISVRVGRPGLSVRARTRIGRVAFVPGLEGAAPAPAGSGAGVPFEMGAFSTPVPGREGLVTVIAAFNTSALTYTTANGASERLAQVGVQSDVSNWSGTLHSWTQLFRVVEATAKSPARPQASLVFSRAGVVPPGTYIVRVALRQGASGNAGAAAMTVRVDSASGGSVVGDVILVSRVERVARPPAGAHTQPLMWKDSVLVPNLSKVVRRRDGARVAVPMVLQRQGHGVSAIVELRGPEGATSDAFEVAADGTSRAVAVRALDVAAMVPGEYTIRVRVGLRSGPVERQTSFRLVD
jgi:VWFA-related protein